MHLIRFAAAVAVFFVPTLGQANAPLTNADVAGNWRFLDLSVFTFEVRAEGTSDPFNVGFAGGDFENTDNILTAEGVFIEIGFGSGRWFALNNVLFGYIDGDPDIGSAFLSCEADTLGIADAEVAPDTDMDGLEEIFAETSLIIGIQYESIEPADVPGEWYFFSYEVQALSFSSGVVDLDGFNINEGLLTLTPSAPGSSTGTFSITFSTVSDPSDGPPLGVPITGTWAITFDGLELNTGLEIITFPELSAGNDLFITESLEEDTFPGGDFIAREVTLLMKRPATSPSFAQLADEYQVAGFTFNWDDDPGSLSTPQYGGADFEVSEVRIRSDGTGRVDLIDGSDTDFTSDAFTYSILASGAGIETTSIDDGDTTTVRLSEQLDFGYFIEIEDNPVLNETEDYTIGFVFRKPEIEGIEDSLASGEAATGGTPTAPKLLLSIDTENGLCYGVNQIDLETGAVTSLTEVCIASVVTPLPILGDGSRLTVEIPIPAGAPNGFFEYAIVPCPIPSVP
ncbi:MAG: hypothetical protein ACFB20_09130 [Opitutales bacterium]